MNVKHATCVFGFGLLLFATKGYAGQSLIAAGTLDASVGDLATKTFKPLEKKELAALLARTRDAALSGKYELFKTSTRFDGTARNPQWMG